MGLPFSAEQVSELGEETVSGILNAKSFPIVNSNLVFVPVSLWFDLKGVGVKLPVPEPLRTPELNKLRVCHGNVSQVLKKPFPFWAVLNTESNIGYAVCNKGRAIRDVQTLRIVAILLTRMHEVPIAALKSEAVWKILETLHDIHNGAINRVSIQRSQGCLPLLKIMRVIYEVLGFCECFQLPVPFLNAAARIYAAISRRLASEVLPVVLTESSQIISAAFCAGFIFMIMLFIRFYPIQ